MNLYHHHFFYCFALKQCCNLEFFLRHFSEEHRDYFASSFCLFLLNFANKNPKIKCFHWQCWHNNLLSHSIELCSFFLTIGEVRVLKSCTKDTTKVHTHSACVLHRHEIAVTIKLSSPAHNFQWQKLSIAMTSKISRFISIFYSLFWTADATQLNKDNWLESKEQQASDCFANHRAIYIFIEWLRIIFAI